MPRLKATRAGAGAGAGPQESPAQSSSRPRRKRGTGDQPGDANEKPADAAPSKRRRVSRNGPVEPEPEPEPEPEEDEGNPGDGSEQEQEDQGEGEAGEEQQEESIAQTPSGRKRRRSRIDGTEAEETGNNGVSTPSRRALRTRTAPVTPVKTNGINGTGTPSRRNLADRSARRKSARALIDRVVAGNTSDDEAGDEDLEKEIYESSEEEEEEEADEDAEEEEPEDAASGESEAEAAEGSQEEEAVPETPSKSTPGRKPRGRPRKGPKPQAPAATRGRRKKQRSPTPPRDLPAHEQYFYHNKPGAATAGKTSGNTLAALKLLTHEEYFTLMRAHEDRHAEGTRFLASLHAASFPQWSFELAQGFGVCLYGYGSKRALLRRFATYLFRENPQDSHRIVIVNGYVPTTTVREVLATLGAALDASSSTQGSSRKRLPSSNPVAMAQGVLSLLSASDKTLTVMINSIDAPALRKPAAQAVLAQLAAHPRLRLVCSADTPDFALLWDGAARSALNLVFHDCTTFAPLASPSTGTGASEVDAVDVVHELLGRRARRVGGRDGVAFVLRSLPENAKDLFRLLVGEVLVGMEGEDGGGGEEDGEGAESLGVEYRMLYNKAVEEFICSSEMAFRTLLKEFHDHQMIISRKDILGTELLSLPFRREELEAILEDLMS